MADRQIQRSQGRYLPFVAVPSAPAARFYPRLACGDWHKCPALRNLITQNKPFRRRHVRCSSALYRRLSERFPGTGCDLQQWDRGETTLAAHREKSRKSVALFARRKAWMVAESEQHSVDLEVNGGRHMNGIIGLMVQLISGAVGGNVAGSLLKQYDLGFLGNSIAGILGGGIGGQVIALLLGGGAVAGAAGGFDIGSILAQVAAGGVGGGILMVIVGIVRQALSGHPRPVS